mgnify:CR=1 FL=1
MNIHSLAIRPKTQSVQSREPPKQRITIIDMQKQLETGMNIDEDGDRSRINFDTEARVPKTHESTSNNKSSRINN